MIAAIVLIIVGVALSLLGLKLFKIMLPLIGLIGGMMAGFIGFQGVFGTGFVSTTLAVLLALIVGVVLALLSFVFFEFAVWLYMALLMSGLFGYIGMILGLSGNGFIMFLLSLCGFIVGAMIASHDFFSINAMIALTSFIGTAFVLAGIFLLVGKVELGQLNTKGVTNTAMTVIHDSFIWMFVWLGSSLVAMRIQQALLIIEILNNDYAYKQITAKGK